MSDLITNKKATFNYELLERFEAGVELFGFEVKALRAKMANLAGAYVIIRGGEVFLIGAHISPYQQKNTPSDYEPERARKLLLTKKEIGKLERELNTAGLTLVPIKWYNKSGKLKLEIALVRGKKKADKRESIKARDTKRDLDRELKHG
jgi:SsrA-binding protein